MKGSKFLVSALMILGLVALVVGCGTTSTNYYYYYPDWTPDGKIVCTKNRQVVSGGQGGFLGSGTEISNNYYLTIMDEDVSNERDIKSIENPGRVAVSPLGNYYAYAEGDYVKVVDTDGNETSSVDCGNEIYNLDWSSDEKKIVFNKESSRLLYVYNITSSSVSEISSIDASSPSWRYNSKIVFFNWISSVSHLSFIDSDGSNLTNTSLTSEVGSFPQYTGDEEYVMTVSSVNYKKIDVSSEAVVETIVHSLGDNIWNIRISSDLSKVLVTNDAGSEIWIANFDGSGLKQLR